MALEVLGEIAADAGRRRSLLDGCLADAPHRAESLEKRLLAPGTDAGDVIELTAERPLAADVSVIGDREPLRIVADALDELERLRATRQDVRI